MNPMSAPPIWSGADDAIQSKRPPVWLAWVPKVRNPNVGDPPLIIAPPDCAVGLQKKSIDELSNPRHVAKPRPNILSTNAQKNDHPKRMRRTAVPERALRNDRSGAPPTGHNRGMRVLVVEDEVALAEAVRDGLAAEGFDVDMVHDGLDGLWRAREGSYDAIVLDILLPGMNGYKVCRTLREEEVWTPILMLTAKDGEYDEAEALDTGADDFLSKPFSFVVLLARLRALFRRGSPPRPAVLEHGPLRLDPATRSAAHGNVEVALTAREFSLLEYLMRRDGHVASKPEILDHVWGMDFAGDPNVVEVYIGYLRRKLDETFDTKLIHTVRGSGYRLCAEPG